MLSQTGTRRLPNTPPPPREQEELAAPADPLHPDTLWPAAAVPTKAKPLMRGWSHAAAAAGSALLLWQSMGALSGDSLGGTGTGRYLMALVALFTFSALYHMGSWSPRLLVALRRLDYACIFFFIAACVSPLVEAGQDLALRRWCLNLIWILTGGFMLSVIAVGPFPRPVRTAMYVGLGVLGAVCAVLCESAVGVRTMSLFVTAGVIHLLGAVVYLSRRPDPLPGIFGYHEVFHLIVIVANLLMLLGLRQGG